MPRPCAEAGGENIAAITIAATAVSPARLRIGVSSR
jgi:hypothetical protein